MRTRGHRWNPAGWMQRGLRVRGGGGPGHSSTWLIMPNKGGRKPVRHERSWKLHPVCQLASKLSWYVYIYMVPPPRPTNFTRVLVFTVKSAIFGVKFWIPGFGGCHVVYIYTYIYIYIYIYIRKINYKINHSPLPPLCTSLACKRLQAVASIVTPSPGFKIQDSKRTSRFKIQDPKRTSWIQSPGFKIQASRSKKNFLNPTSCLQRGVARAWIQEVVFESWLLNLESGTWIQEKPLKILNLESWIQDSGFKKFFLDLESWILNPPCLQALCKQAQTYTYLLGSLEPLSSQQLCHRPGPSEAKDYLWNFCAPGSLDCIDGNWFPQASVQPTTLSSPRTVWSQRLLVELLRAWLLGLHDGNCFGQWCQPTWPELLQLSDGNCFGQWCQPTLPEVLQLSEAFPSPTAVNKFALCPVSVCLSTCHGDGAASHGKSGIAWKSRSSHWLSSSPCKSTSGASAPSYLCWGAGMESASYPPPHDWEGAAASHGHRAKAAESADRLSRWMDWGRHARTSCLAQQEKEGCTGTCRSPWGTREQQSHFALACSALHRIPKTHLGPVHYTRNQVRKCFVQVSKHNPRLPIDQTKNRDKNQTEEGETGDPRRG